MRNDLFVDDLAPDTYETQESVDVAEFDSQPCCEKCNAPIVDDMVTICRNCGWYANLGTFVELDQRWETALEADPTSQPAAKSHLRVWYELLPSWSWVILASVVVVVLESVAARFVTSEGSSLRTAWSLSQLAVGLVLGACCHIFTFMVLAADDADFGVLDILLRPVKIWLRAIHQLPNRLWVANMAACGIVAGLMSVLVIGGLPYERLWDWGFQEPIKQNLMGAVMDRAKKLESGTGADNLEDAVGDFAGSQNPGDTGNAAKTPPPKPRLNTDCVILGFQTDREGRLDTLLLGTVHRSKLVYAGRVTPKLSEEELGKMLESLRSIKSLQPFIPIQADATWVQPKLACRVTFAERQSSGILREIEWERILGQLQAQ